ncbi:MAG: hypothetical protein JSW70_08475 [Syntrophobacterales bacterium]|nr:MAG: hypothetical protein JSW70_08475 [Syntrophobacterales bacterium]
MFFKLILEGGHLGAGKSYDIVKYLKGRDIFFVFNWAFNIPRVKKKESRKGIKLIKEISKKEYMLGKNREKRDPYLNPPHRHIS